MLRPDGALAIWGALCWMLMRFYSPCRNPPALSAVLLPPACVLPAGVTLHSAIPRLPAGYCMPFVTNPPGRAHDPRALGALQRSLLQMNMCVLGPHWDSRRWLVDNR